MLSLRFLLVVSICLSVGVFARRMAPNQKNINGLWEWWGNPYHTFVNKVGSEVWVEYIYGVDVNRYDFVEFDGDDVILSNSNPFNPYRYIKLSDYFVTYARTLRDLEYHIFTISYRGRWVVDPSKKAPPPSSPTTAKPNVTTNAATTTVKP